MNNAEIAELTRRWIAGHARAGVTVEVSEWPPEGLQPQVWVTIGGEHRDATLVMAQDDTIDWVLIDSSSGDQVGAGQLVFVTREHLHAALEFALGLVRDASRTPDQALE